MTADIKVIRKTPGQNITYNQATRTYTGNFQTVYEGKARVQPYGIIGDELLAQDPTGKRLMRVQIREKGCVGYSTFGISEANVVFSASTPLRLQCCTVSGKVGGFDNLADERFGVTDADAQEACRADDALVADTVVDAGDLVVAEQVFVFGVAVQLCVVGY